MSIESVTSWRRMATPSLAGVDGSVVERIKFRPRMVPPPPIYPTVIPFGMLPGEFLSADSIQLNLVAQSRELALEAMVGLLQLRERSATTLLRLLARRELLGSTAVGRGIAIPHCRSLVVPRVRMAYARLAEPLAWDSIDGEPVRHIFLIVAPPVEVSNQYLPTLGQLARATRQPEFRAALDAAHSAEEIARLLQGKVNG